MKRLGKDVVKEDNSAAVRLPNRLAKGLKIDEKSGTAVQMNDRDVIMSPSNYLSGQISPRALTFQGEDVTNTNKIEFEGEMVRKATETKLKRYWYCLLGKELYVYKHKDE